MSKPKPVTEQDCIAFLGNHYWYFDHEGKIHDRWEETSQRNEAYLETKRVYNAKRYHRKKMESAK